MDIKLSNFAWDLNMSPEELIQMFRVHGDYSKTPLSSITIIEANWVLEKVTQENIVEDLNEYFASKDDIRKGKVKMIDKLYCGMMVTGRVMAVTTTEAIVDVDSILYGYAPIEELTFDLSKKPADIVRMGEELEFIVLKVNRSEGNVRLRLASLDSQREELKRQKEQQRLAPIVNDVLTQVQENLSAMKPGLISEIAVSVYSQIDTKMMAENIALKERVCELEKRLLQLERIIDKLRIEE